MEKSRHAEHKVNNNNLKIQNIKLIIIILKYKT